MIADPKRNSRACITGEIRRQNGGITIAMAVVTPPMFRILFVSPDGDLRAVASRVLARAGWEVTTAAHAGHASLASTGIYTEATWEEMVEAVEALG